VGKINTDEIIRWFDVGGALHVTRRRSGGAVVVIRQLSRRIEAVREHRAGLPRWTIGRSSQPVRSSCSNLWSAQEVARSDSGHGTAGPSREAPPPRQDLRIGESQPVSPALRVGRLEVAASSRKNWSGRSSTDSPSSTPLQARIGLSFADVQAREERVPSLVARLTSRMAMGSQNVLQSLTPGGGRPTRE